MGEIEDTEDSPDEECPWCGRDVRLLAGVVNVAGTRNRVDVGAQEDEVNQDVDDLRRPLSVRFSPRTERRHTHLEEDAV